MQSGQILFVVELHFVRILKITKSSFKAINCISYSGSYDFANARIFFKRVHAESTEAENRHYIVIDCNESSGQVIDLDNY